MTRAVALAAGLVAALLLAVGNGAAAPVQTATLTGTVGPEFTITLADAQGNRVTRLDPGTYRIEIEDLSDFHTYHLEGPGVDERTEVAFTGRVTWTVTFRDGVYVYHCDPHPDLRGQFVVGNPQQPQPPPSPSPSPPPPPRPGVVTAKTKLVLSAGPSPVISLKTAAGKAVKQLKRGTYTVTVRDRSRLHNARIVAPGYNRATKVPYVGQQTWRVRLARAGTLRFLCDPHARQGMRGSAKIVA